MKNFEFIPLFTKRVLLKEFAEPKFTKGDNFYKVTQFFEDKECQKPACSQRGWIRKNQEFTNFNCFKYRLIFIN